MCIYTYVYRYFPDLQEEDFESSVALVHSRFSTNTFPAWRRAHPFRYICHNGDRKTDSTHHRHPEGVVYRSFCLSSATFAVAQVHSRRGWCVESLFPTVVYQSIDFTYTLIIYIFIL